MTTRRDRNLNIAIKHAAEELLTMRDEVKEILKQHREQMARIESEFRASAESIPIESNATQESRSLMPQVGEQC